MEDDASVRIGYCQYFADCRSSDYYIECVFSFFPVMLWISALASGVRIGIITLVAMRLRRVTPSRIVNPLIKATKAGLGLNINQLESHFLAGGM